MLWCNVSRISDIEGQFSNHCPKLDHLYYKHVISVAYPMISIKAIVVKRVDLIVLVVNLSEFHEKNLFPGMKPAGNVCHDIFFQKKVNYSLSFLHDFRLLHF